MVTGIREKQPQVNSVTKSRKDQVDIGITRRKKRTLMHDLENRHRAALDVGVSLEEVKLQL